MEAMPDASSRLASTFGKWSGLFARLCLAFHLTEAAASRVRTPGGLHPLLHVVTAETANRVRDYMRAVLMPSLLRAETLMFGTTQTERRQLGSPATSSLTAWNGSPHARSSELYRSLRPPEERGTSSAARWRRSACSAGWRQCHHATKAQHRPHGASTPPRMSCSPNGP